MFKKINLLLGGLALLLVGCSKPMANFSYSGESKAFSEVGFQNESKKAESYTWDFGDGQESTEVAPKHLYKAPGDYTISLLAKKGTKIDSLTKQITIAAPQGMMVEIETKFGNMKVLLYDETPLHRDNFLKLISEGFYDDLLFHRVMNNFMIQGGDPESRGAAPKVQLGSGGPGYTVPAEFKSTLYHKKGALAAARQPDQVNPNKASSGSQFYIVQGKTTSARELENMQKQRNGQLENMAFRAFFTDPANAEYTKQLQAMQEKDDRAGVEKMINELRPQVMKGQEMFTYTPEMIETYSTIGGTHFLDGQYTVFGEVVEGLEVMEKIALEKVDRANRPNTDVKMKIQIVN